MTYEWLSVILLECYSVLLFCRSAVLLFVAAGLISHSDFWNANTQLQIEAIRSCGPTQKTLTM